MKYTTDKYIAKGNQDICEDSIIVEQINEDSLLCIIADGMGELDNASDASRLVVEEIHDFILVEISEEKTPIESILSGAIEKANKRISKERQQLFCRMGAAVAILLCHNNQAYISWLGDVRVYLVRDSRLHLLTMDHTIENLKNVTVIDSKKYSYILTRCIKGSELTEIPLITKEIASGDRFILCSDGFYSNIEEKILSTSSINSIVGNIGNPEDDYSVIEICF